MNLQTLTTLNQLLTKTGCLNSALIKKPEFKQHPLYAYVFEHSHELDVFDDERIGFAHRFWFIYDNMKVDHCIKCGKPRIVFERQQLHISMCNHKQTFDTDLLNQHRNNKKASILNTIKSDVNNKVFHTNKNEIIEIAKTINAKPDNFTFPICEKFAHAYSDFILYTPFIKVNFENMRLKERCYCLANNITSIPLCSYCNKNELKFLNRKVGYEHTCHSDECSQIKSNNTRGVVQGKMIREKIDSIINTAKYEVISYPKLVNTEPLKIKCKKCSHITDVWLHNGRIKCINKNNLRCEACESTTSVAEKEVAQFIQSLGFEIETRNRKIISPNELDIYVKDKKIAFEYDGLYWHSNDTEHNHRYHLNKTEKCEKQGIQLIHIFENEWLYKQDIVKSRIKNLLGKYDATVFARKCEIKAVDSKTSREFQIANHIQGAANASVNIGLYFNNELISLMTFSKPRFSKKYEWELLRFCNKLGYHIPGAAGKLLKYFERNYNPKTLISYADRRWSQGKVYKALGFDLDHISAPNYWYWKYNFFLESRVVYQKNKQQKILEKFDPNLTEIENMKNNGYSRIFDCGNLVFVKKY